MDHHLSHNIKADTDDASEEAEGKEDEQLPADDHLMTLKALTEKLRLETRRPSYLEWKARVEADSFRGQTGTGQSPVQAKSEGESVPTREGAVNCDGAPSGVLNGFGNIDEALSWLRRELVRPHLSYRTPLYLPLWNPQRNPTHISERDRLGL